MNLKAFEYGKERKMNSKETSKSYATPSHRIDNNILMMSGMKFLSTFEYGKKRKMNSKGMSTVIAWIIGIGMVLVMIAIIWAMINTFLGENLGQATTCVDLLDEVTLNGVFTCNSPDPGVVNEDNRLKGNYLLVSFDVGDVELDSVIMRVQDDKGSTKSIEIEEGVTKGSVIGMYGGSDADKYGAPELPDKYEGFTYILKPDMGSVTSVGIVPVLDGKECGEMDRINGIELCSDSIQDNVNKYARLFEKRECVGTVDCSSFADGDSSCSDIAPLCNLNGSTCEGDGKCSVLTTQEECGNAAYVGICTWQTS